MGDWVVELLRFPRGAVEVWPPFRLARKELVIDPVAAAGAKYIYTLEVRTDQEPITLKRFRQRMERVGVNGDLDRRRFRRRRVVEAIWSLWPEEALRKRDGGRG